MASTMLHPDAKTNTQGVVIFAASFNANNTSNPLSSSFRGDGVSTVVRDGVGEFTVTLKPGHTYRYVLSKHADLEDLAEAGPPDGSYANLGPVSNEASGTALTFKLYTFVKGGTLTDFTSRRVSFTLFCKNSSAGT